MKTISIVGAGFCGTMTAVNLARLSDQALRVILINAHRPLGRGTAYGTKRPEHVLNVVARNMSAFPDKPSHFVEWLSSRHEFADRRQEELQEMFAPRRVYGDYLRGLLAACMNPIDARNPVEVESVEGEVIGVKQEASGAYSIELRSGVTCQTDQVVLATGNQPPRSFPSSAPLRYDPRYRSDPWDEWLSRLPPPGGTILLLGTGLTMVDIVLTLSEIGWEGKIVAISRHGRLPRSHFRGIAYEDIVSNEATDLSLKGLRRLVQQHCERLTGMSQNPAIAIDKLRPHTQRLWKGLTAGEKLDFLKNDASQWNVIRHRIAANIHNKVTDALDSGRLEVIAGTVVELEPNEKTIEVVQEDASGIRSSIAGDLIINCTGPHLNLSGSDAPLYHSLIERRLAVADEMDMGIQVDENYSVLVPGGESNGDIYAIGPIIRGSLWETTAVPELRAQALRVAEQILEREHSSPESSEVIEYFI
ncbi:MAG: FAD/NAD(P)-binding protein [Aureliella sp.]